MPAKMTFTERYLARSAAWDEAAKEIMGSQTPYVKLNKSRLVMEMASNLDEKFKKLCDRTDGYFHCIMLNIEDDGAGGPQHVWKHSFARRLRVFRERNADMVFSLMSYSTGVMFNLPVEDFAKFYAFTKFKMVEIMTELDQFEADITAFKESEDHATKPAAKLRTA